MKINHLCTIAITLYLFCSTQNDTSVIQGTVSSCGGFNVSLSKGSSHLTTLIGDTIVKEYLNWNYDDSTRSLEILHTGCVFNCAAELSIEAIKKDDTITIIEKDHRYDENRSGGTETGCSCVYDFRITIPVIANSESFILIHKDKVYEVKATDRSGRFTMDSN